MMPWYLLAPYGLIEFLPRWVSLQIRSSLLLVLLLVFVFFPFLDPAPKPSDSRKRKAQLFGIVVFVFWIVFSVYGHFLDLPAG
jgi:quinol-cytochrome oxidoreductase complex cytochrome b subunit